MEQEWSGRMCRVRVGFRTFGFVLLLEGAPFILARNGRMNEQSWTK